ncbi:PSD1 and planctomycete cytochrome C domain-containing protein [Haloferula sp. A504]|uniref:PSD1 and planctomycete cytochrome C domain-containing protein n=1 Tax=Haloferula sp. A504 TaxID=3373601 RepID=UPI0031BBF046|nr:PSD1 and planctomycete cytochrome C domain-containing protein [Verrucomicrobiaceae bacterium E54]
MSVWIVGLAGLAMPFSAVAEEVRFNHDIRPILSQKCIACHGPDAKHRAAELRLDTPEGAYAALEEGIGHAIVPGDPDASVLMARILSDDPEVVMPPPKFNKTVTPEEQALLRRWIEQGAEYEAHWAYVPLKRPEVPKPRKHAGLVRNPIDAFILDRLEEEGIEPSPEADPATLKRRISLDLTGLPPEPGGNENVVQTIERALGSEAFGERMAVPWLDVVRFADTVGYHGDQNQRIFPYRDYVIDAFNDNKPFDVFVREQLAGDLLPDATDEQHIASGFNRLNLVTREGGAQSKEYFKKYAADRVRAVGTAFLGQTTACAECHDHKYDPITQRDFYSLAAFFDDVMQWGVYNNYVGGTKYTGNNDPYTPERIVRPDSLVERLNLLRDRAFQSLETEMVSEAPVAGLQDLREFAKGHPDGWAPLKPVTVRSEKATPHELGEDSTVRFSGPAVKDERTGIELEFAADRLGSLRLEALPDPEHGAVGRESGGHFTLKPEFFLVPREGDPQKLAIRWSQADLDREHGFAGGIDHGDRRTLQLDPKQGWQSAPKPGYEGPDSLVRRTQTAVFCLENPLEVPEGAMLKVVLAGNTASILRVSQSPVLDPVAGEAAFTEAFHRALREDSTTAHAAWHLCETPPAKLPQGYRDLLDQIRECRSGWTRTLVTVKVDKPEFPTRILPRGDWQNDSGELVEPAVLSFLPSESLPKDRKLTRLDLAEWIVADENPLTARHFVNRLWKQFFGRGLSNILDDLGGQGEPPSHPDLLDWLAVEFRESGWDVKHMVRLILDSHAYRQESARRGDLLEVDPYNRLFAQQGARRLDAEFIRDQALAVAGLLDTSYVGGPSVRVYQPENYYANLNFPTRTYAPHLDFRQHRRSVYVHWQRTFLLPTLANFDAPARDECAADRLQANIPQQALTLLNDPVYVEAARGFAVRVLSETPDAEPAGRLARMFELVLSRQPDQLERQRLLDFQKRQEQNFREGTDDANAFLGIGIAPVPEGFDAHELAAWTQTARLVLNLHESITRY